jgi:hypothetical protein
LGLFRPKTLDRLGRYELPDFDHFLRPAAVPVIAIPLAFRRTAARATEATNGPAVQSLTWTPTVKNPRLKKSFSKNRKRPTAEF